MNDNKWLLSTRDVNIAFVLIRRCISTRHLNVYIWNSVAHFNFWVFDSQTHVNSFILNSVRKCQRNNWHWIFFRSTHRCLDHSIHTLHICGCACIVLINMTFKFGCNFVQFLLRVCGCLRLDGLSLFRFLYMTLASVIQHSAHVFNRTKFRIDQPT